MLNITLLLLSCGRPALLNRTVTSLYQQIPPYLFDEMLLIDCKDKINLTGFTSLRACETKTREENIMCNIHRLYNAAKTTYVLFTEDDWEFVRSKPPLKEMISPFMKILDVQKSATSLQLSGLNKPFYHNKTRAPHLHKGSVWVWTNSPAGPNGNFGSWTNNPHIAKLPMPFPDLSHEGKNSVAMRRLGYTNIQSVQRYVRHIGKGYHVKEGFLSGLFQ